MSDRSRQPTLPRGGRRGPVFAIAAILALIALMLPMSAGFVAGHNAVVTASMDCAGTVSFKVFDWTTDNTNKQAETTLTMSYQLNGAGAFTGSPSIAFTDANHVDATNIGIAGTPFSAGTATSVLVRAVAAQWGDGNNNPGPYDAIATRPDPCVSTTVTAIHAGAGANDTAGAAAITSAPIGSTVHDKATVSGSVGTPTGTVTFTWYTTQNCTGTGAGKGTVTLASGVAHPSDDVVVPVGGGSFRAHYNGSATYAESNGACEPLTGSKLTSTDHHRHPRRQGRG